MGLPTRNRLRLRLKSISFSKKILMLVFSLLLCITQSGCALLQLPFSALDSIVGMAGSVTQLGIAAAPYAAPFFM